MLLVLVPDIAVTARLGGATRSVGLGGGRNRVRFGRDASLLSLGRAAHLGVREDDEVLVLVEALERDGLVVLCIQGDEVSTNENVTRVPKEGRKPRAPFWRVTSSTMSPTLYGVTAADSSFLGLSAFLVEAAAAAVPRAFGGARFFGAAAGFEAETALEVDDFVFLPWVAAGFFALVVALSSAFLDLVAVALVVFVSTPAAFATFFAAGLTTCFLTSLTAWPAFFLTSATTDSALSSALSFLAAAAAFFFAAAAAAAVALAACCALTLACCFSASVTRLERRGALVPRVLGICRLGPRVRRESRREMNVICEGQTIARGAKGAKRVSSGAKH